MKKLKTDPYVLYVDDKLIIASKPAGVSVSPDRTEGLDLMSILKRKASLHVITRLDKPVSGIVLYAKNATNAAEIQNVMHAGGVKKTYLAIVEGSVSDDEGRLEDLISKGRNHKAYIDPAKGKKCIMQYTVVERLERYTILHVSTETGRFHQIRCQLAHFGHPIKGDVKYGARRKNKDRSIHLHAYTLDLNDEKYVCPVPEDDALWQIAAQAVSK